MRGKSIGAVATVALTVLTLSGCAMSDPNEVRVGSQLAIDSLDPAVGYTEGSIELANQVYGFLLKGATNSELPALDLATSAAWTSPTEYDVTLPAGLMFANGNPLTASDVVFSVQRALALEATPAALLAGLDSVAATDELSVRFTVKSPNDVTFPWLLTTVAVAIVDEDSFPADAELSGSELAASGGFAGPMELTAVGEQSADLAQNPNYAGSRNRAGTRTLHWQSYDDPNALQRDAEAGELDALYGVTPTLGGELDSSWSALAAPSGTTVVLVVADGLPGDAAAQQLARQAIAHSIDREALRSDWQNTLTSLVPFDVWGSFDQPPVEAPAPGALADTPIALTLRYASDSTAELAEALAAQLDATGMFAITPERVNPDELLEDGWHLNLIEWVPDYAEADNYLTPLILGGSLGAAGPSAELTEQVLAQAFQPDANLRQAQLGQIQSELADAHTLLPVVQRNRVVLTRAAVQPSDALFDVPQLVSLGALTVAPAS